MRILNNKTVIKRIGKEMFFYLKKKNSKNTKHFNDVL